MAEECPLVSMYIVAMPFQYLYLALVSLSDTCAVGLTYITLFFFFFVVNNSPEL